MDADPIDALLDRLAASSRRRDLLADALAEALAELDDESHLHLQEVLIWCSMPIGDDDVEEWIAERWSASVAGDPNLTATS